MCAPLSLCSYMSSFMLYQHLSSFFFFFFFLMIRRPPRSTLSLHDALPISSQGGSRCMCGRSRDRAAGGRCRSTGARSEEHTSELQSRLHLVCRLLLEKKKKTYIH